MHRSEMRPSVARPSAADLLSVYGLDQRRCSAVESPFSSRRVSASSGNAHRPLCDRWTPVNCGWFMLQALLACVFVLVFVLVVCPTLCPVVKFKPLQAVATPAPYILDIVFTPQLVYSAPQAATCCEADAFPRSSFCPTAKQTVSDSQRSRSGSFDLGQVEHQTYGTPDIDATRTLARQILTLRAHARSQTKQTILTHNTCSCLFLMLLHIPPECDKRGV